MSQDLTFSQTVNRLFFGVDVASTSISLFDSLLTMPQLKHYDNRTRQWNLNVSMDMNSDKAWSSKHEFNFTESPLLDMTIEKGTIEVTLGETESTKKVLALNWRLQFGDKVTARKYYNRLIEIFSEISTIKKISKEKGVGEMAQFSSRKQVDVGVKDITLFLGSSTGTNKYELTLLLGTEFMDE